MILVVKQEEIVNEIRRMFGDIILLPSLGWHFNPTFTFYSRFSC